MQCYANVRILKLEDGMELKDGKRFVRLVNTPSGFFTTAAAVDAQVETDLDKIVDNLLRDVDVPLRREE